MNCPDFIRRYLYRKVAAVMQRREPDFQIGPKGAIYLQRWFAIPRNKWFNIYLHRFLMDDLDEALHDHPWVNCSILLDGSYYEVIFAEDRDSAHFTRDNYFYKSVYRREGSITFRRAVTAHRVVLLKSAATKEPKPTISLFLTGPLLRTWGFDCPKGWIPYTQYAKVDERSSVVGKGCP